MANRLEKIKGYDDQIAQLMNRKKQEMQKHKAEERKARTKRLCSRMGLIESIIPDTITLTEEQFEKFVKQHIANDHGRRILAKFTVQGDTTANPAKPETRANSTDKTPVKTETTQQEAATPTPCRARAHLYVLTNVCALPGASVPIGTAQAALPLVGVARWLSPPCNT